MARFCIYCGTTGDKENPVINGVCLRCRLKRKELVSLKKKSIKVSYCKICGAIKVGYKWVDTSGFEDAISFIINNIVKELLIPGSGVSDIKITGFNLKTMASWRTVVEIDIMGSYGETVFQDREEVVIYLDPVKCPRCIMYNSREFEAVVQIRGVDPSVINRVIVEELNLDNRICRDLIEAIEVAKGIDLYFYTYGAARKIARRIAAKLGNLIVSETYEKAGMRSGKQRARLYISVKPRV